MPFEQGTSAIWNCYPMPHLSVLGGVVDQLVGPALLMFGIFAVVDARNRIHIGAQPVVMGVLVALIQFGFTLNTGAPLNPNRDIAPRIFTYILYGSNVFTAGHHFWVVALLAPCAGTMIGATMYRVLIHS